MNFQIILALVAAVALILLSLSFYPYLVSEKNSSNNTAFSYETSNLRIALSCSSSLAGFILLDSAADVVLSNRYSGDSPKLYLLIVLSNFIPNLILFATISDHSMFKIFRCVSCALVILNISFLCFKLAFQHPKICNRLIISAFAALATVNSLLNCYTHLGLIKSELYWLYLYVFTVALCVFYIYVIQWILHKKWSTNSSLPDKDYMNVVYMLGMLSYVTSNYCCQIISVANPSGNDDEKYKFISYQFYCNAALMVFISLAASRVVKSEFSNVRVN